jgi:tRNA (mo5U34)-methyltransferase
VLDRDALYRDLAEIGLDAWRESLEPLLAVKLADASHGHLAAWRDLLINLPASNAPMLKLDTDEVTIADDSLTATDHDRILESLQRLIPWRKGPFRICGIELDAEWRSDLKWNRLRERIAPLERRNVLDVGCGNGYYALRMRGAGANLVIGVDPTMLFVVQFLALKKIGAIERVHVLPLRLHELPADCGRFDTTFSMGVLYHRREPHAHLCELKASLRPGGQLVLETLIAPGEDVRVLRPRGRYARMRNVWHLPTLAALQRWLDDAGFERLEVVDVATTTIEEQRTTRWMPFESLAEALDPDAPGLTIEALPAPLRAIVIGSAP